MVDLRVTMLAGIVSYALRLAEVALDMEIDPILGTKVRKGIFGSEMWSQAMKKRIADTWDMDVYDIYGLTEAFGPGTSTDCYLHDGLHLWEDHFLVEVIDPKTGEIVEPEEEGELVLTSLSKEALPIIRYRTKDISYLYDALTCECGRTHRRHGPIKGKSDDTLKVKGVNIWPSQVEQVLIGRESVSGEYQLVVDRVGTLDQLTVRIETAKNLGRTKKEELATTLSSELREMMRLTPIVELLNYGEFPREISKPKRAIDLRTK
jgi:phenylacetate-CoA ligase